MSVKKEDVIELDEDGNVISVCSSLKRKEANPSTSSTLSSFSSSATFDRQKVKAEYNKNKMIKKEPLAKDFSMSQDELEAVEGSKMEVGKGDYGDTGDEDLQVVGTKGDGGAANLPHAREACIKKKFDSVNTKKDEFCEKCMCYVCETYVDKCNLWNVHYRAHSKEKLWRKERERRRIQRQSEQREKKGRENRKEEKRKRLEAIKKWKDEGGRYGDLMIQLKRRGEVIRRNNQIFELPATVSTFDEFQKLAETVFGFVSMDFGSLEWDSYKQDVARITDKALVQGRVLLEPNLEFASFTPKGKGKHLFFLVKERWPVNPIKKGKVKQDSEVDFGIQVTAWILYGQGFHIDKEDVIEMIPDKVLTSRKNKINDRKEGKSGNKKISSSSKHFCTFDLLVNVECCSFKKLLSQEWKNEMKHVEAVSDVVTRCFKYSRQKDAKDVFAEFIGEEPSQDKVMRLIAESPRFHRHAGYAGLRHRKDIEDFIIPGLTLEDIDAPALRESKNIKRFFFGFLLRTFRNSSSGIGLVNSATFFPTKGDKSSGKVHLRLKLIISRLSEFTQLFRSFFLPQEFVREQDFPCCDDDWLAEEVRNFREKHEELRRRDTVKEIRFTVEEDEVKGETEFLEQEDRKGIFIPVDRLREQVAAYESTEPTYNMNGLAEELAHKGYPEAKQPEGLHCEMRFYQKQDLQWMIDQEEGPGGVERSLYVPITIADGSKIYYSHCMEELVAKKPAPLHGGMLCDEMGLGKTIVTLALILARPAQEEWLNAEHERTTFEETLDTERINNALLENQKYGIRTREELAGIQLPEDVHKKLKEAPKLPPGYDYGGKAYTVETRIPLDWDEMKSCFETILRHYEPTGRGTLTCQSGKTVNVYFESGKCGLCNAATHRTRNCPKRKTWKLSQKDVDKIEDRRYMSNSSANNSKDLIKWAKARLNVTEYAFQGHGDLIERLRGVKFQTHSDIVQEVKDKFWHRKRIGATLVVCHVSLVDQWRSEAQERSANSLKILAYYGSSRAKNANKLDQYDVIITTFGVIASDNCQRGPGQSRIPKVEFVPPGQRYFWHRIVIDESHMISNKQGQQAKAIAALHSRYRWAVTGTPFSNQILDLFGQLKFLRCAEFDRESRFNMLVSGAGFRKAQVVIKSFLIRHLTNQHLDGKPLLTLPGKSSERVAIEMGDSQMANYKRVLKQKEEEWKLIPEQTRSRHTLQTLQMLRELRLVCSVYHIDPVEEELTRRAEDEAKNPEQLKFECEQCKQKFDGRLTSCCKKQICKECLDASTPEGEQPMLTCLCGEKLYDFERIAQEGNDVAGALDGDEANAADSDFSEGDAQEEEAGGHDGETEGFQAPKRLKGEDGAAIPVTKNASAYRDVLRAELHTKEMEKLVECVKKDETVKTLVFTEFTETIKAISERLKMERIAFEVLAGSITMIKRGTAVKRFANMEKTRVLLVSFRAGSCGINLTAGSQVIIWEPSLNVGSEKQCIGRVFRLGQKKKVKILRFYHPNTVEEKILQIRDAYDMRSKGDRMKEKKAERERSRQEKRRNGKQKKTPASDDVEMDAKSDVDFNEVEDDDLDDFDDDRVLDANQSKRTLKPSDYDYLFSTDPNKKFQLEEI